VVVVARVLVDVGVAALVEPVKAAHRGGGAELRFQPAGVGGRAQCGNFARRRGELRLQQKARGFLVTLGSRVAAGRCAARTAVGAGTDAVAIAAASTTCRQG